MGVFTSSVIVKRQLTQHHELIKHPGVFVKVKRLGELLKAKLCIAGLVKIQGHTGIVGNERADLEAKWRQ